MIFSKVISPDGIAVYRRSQSREEALDRLSSLLEKQVSARGISRRELYELALEREHAGSTAVGRGIAFSHCNSDKIKHLCAVIGIFPDGITSWDEGEKRAIHILFMIASPRKESCRYFAFISHLSRMLRSSELVSKLQKCRNPRDVYNFFSGKENQGKVQAFP